MQTKPFTDEASPDPASTDPNHPLRVVIAYEDPVAGKRAMRLLAGLGQGLGRDIQFEPLPWSFDLLADVDWRSVAASDAVKADLLIIATSTARPLPPAVDQWADGVIRRKQGTSAAVIALFPPGGEPEAAGSSCTKAIEHMAQRAGLDFFAPDRRHELEETLAGIHRRAEMVTPVLDEILHHPLPAPHWEASPSRP